MLPPALKLKVIQQYEAGKLQKDIAHDLGISTGSVSTILHPKYKQKYEGNSDSIPQEQPSVVAIDTVLKPDLQTISQPQSQEIQQQQPLLSSQEPHLEPSGGCPLSRSILQEDIQPQIPEEIEHPKKEDHFSPNYKPVNVTTITSPGKTSQPLADIEDIDFDSEPDIYTYPDAEYDLTYDGDPSNSLEEGWDSEPELERRMQTTARATGQLESFRTQKQEVWPRYKSKTALSNHQDSPIRWDPDNEQSAQTRILKTIIAEREKRAAELLEIQRQRQELEVEKQQIAQMKQSIDQRNNDLKAREAKIAEIEPLIPSATYLNDIGIGFDQALVWIDCIKEVSEKERVDLRTAAWKLAQQLTLSCIDSKMKQGQLNISTSKGDVSFLTMRSLWEGGQATIGLCQEI